MSQTPLSPGDVTVQVDELEALDAAIVEAIRVRVALARTIGLARLAAGHPRALHKDDLALFTRYQVLGADGGQLALALLRLSRKLG